MFNVSPGSRDSAYPAHPGRPSVHFFLGMLAVAFGLALIPSARAQDAAQNVATVSSPASQGESSSLAFLPDAPLPAGSATSEPEVDPGQNSPARRSARSYRIFASKYDKTILAGEIAPKLSTSDELVLGFRSSVSEIAITGWFLSAIYEQSFNNSPKYGQTPGGFGQRLGAAALRATSEDVISTSFIAPLTHVDPRYYALGGRHNPVARLAYAATRPFIARTNDGHQTFNYADIGGDLVGSALTQAYYPPPDLGFDATMKTFGGSVLGSMLGDVVREFLAGGKIEAKIKDTLPKVP